MILAYSSKMHNIIQVPTSAIFYNQGAGRYCPHLTFSGLAQEEWRPSENLYPEKNVSAPTGNLRVYLILNQGSMRKLATVVSSSAFFWRALLLGYSQDFLFFLVIYIILVVWIKISGVCSSVEFLVCELICICQTLSKNSVFWSFPIIMTVQLLVVGIILCLKCTL